MLKTVIRRPITLIMIMIVIVGFGVYQTGLMPVTLIPNLQIPMLAVTTTYPGATAQSVDNEVTNKIASMLAGLSDVTEITSYSVDNASTILLEFEHEVDLDQKTNDIRRGLEQLSLPSGVTPSKILKIDFNAAPAISIAVVAKRLNVSDLSLATVRANELVSKLQTVDGVAEVSVIGQLSTQVQVVPKIATNPSILYELGNIVTAIQSAAASIPLGTIETTDGVISIGSSGLDKDDQFLLENIPVKLSSGKVVTLLSLCDIETNVVYPNGQAFHNGDSAIVLEVTKTIDSNMVNVVEEVKRIASECPTTEGDSTFEYAVINDEAVTINNSISNVVSSLIIGGVLAVIVIFLFLRNIKSSLIIAISMPLSVMATLVVISSMGISLNIVSLGGLAIGIGMLVDNSIVVIESIYQRRETKISPFESAVLGVKDVFGSIFAGTLTTVCVFIPILFITGLTKEIFSELAWSVIWSLIFSLLFACTVVPTLYYLFFKKDVNEFSEGKVMEKLSSGLDSVLHKLLPKKLIVLLISLVVFLVSAALVVATGTEFLPSINDGRITISVQTDAGSLESVLKATDEVEKKIVEFSEQKGVEILNRDINVGQAGVFSQKVAGSISINLAEKSKVNNWVYDFTSYTEELPYQITITASDGVVSSLTSGISQLEVQLKGDNAEDLKEVATLAMAKLKANPNFRNVRSNMNEDTVGYEITPDYAKCNLYGVSTSDFAQLMLALRAAISGVETANLSLSGDFVTVKLGLQSDYFEEGITLIENFVIAKITQPIPMEIKLKDIATVEPYNRQSLIQKQNGKLVLAITAQENKISSGEAGKIMNKEVADIVKDYPSVEAIPSGVQSYLGDAFNGLIIAFVVALFLLFAVMASQFESLVKPLLVMTSIPLCMTGAFLALVITGKTLNVVSFIGLIMLIGVIVNNAIIMIDKIQELTNKGVDPYFAVIEGSCNRLRPILMTTITTVLGLLPLALGIGTGSQLMQPLAIVAIGGLLVGTVVTLVIIPCFYCLIYRVKKN